MFVEVFLRSLRTATVSSSEEMLSPSSRGGGWRQFSRDTPPPPGSEREAARECVKVAGEGYPGDRGCGLRLPHRGLSGDGLCGSCWGLSEPQGLA